MIKKEIIDHVRHQLNQGQARLQSHITSLSGQLYPKRSIFYEVKKFVEDFIGKKTEQRWVIIPGLRGVGKTTVVSQIFLELLQKYEAHRVLYISMDEISSLLNANLKETLDAYENILGQSFEELDQPVFIFVDEVHYDENWGITLKSLFDRSKNVLICCTGSSAISLQTNSDVYRRVLVNPMFPLSFTEYQMLKNDIDPNVSLKEKIIEACFFCKDTKKSYTELKKLQIEVSKYWHKIKKFEVQQYLAKGSLPFALQFSNDHQLYETINGLLDKIILKDIESLKSFDQRTIKSIKKLLWILADAGDVISLNKLPNLINMDSKITIQSVLETLQQAEVLLCTRPRGSKKTSMNKPNKYSFMSSSIRMALLGTVGKEATFQSRSGKLLEDMVCMTLTRAIVVKGLGNISYDPSEGGADFILEIANRIEIPIEVGMGKKTTKQVEQTMQKITSNFGLSISNRDLYHFSNENIISLPLEYFLLI